MFVYLISSVDIIACSKCRLSGDQDEMVSDRSWPAAAARTAMDRPLRAGDSGPEVISRHIGILNYTISLQPVPMFDIL
jgi:hypothetical protein